MSIYELESKLNYTFNDKNILIQALTHKSLNKNNYERLEFVGDGLLDYVIAFNLFKLYPDLPEGDLSKMRSDLVDQKALVEIAHELELGKYLLLGNGALHENGRERPSILADTVEAIFAAVNVDSTFENAKFVIERLYGNRLQGVTKLAPKDYKSLLQNFVQKSKIELPAYTELEAIGPVNNRIFSIQCEVKELNLNTVGQGKSKKEAGQMAANKILQLIDAYKITIKD